VGRDAGGYREPAALLHVAHALAVRAGVAIEAPVRYIPVLFRSVENPNRECSSMVELPPSKHGYINPNPLISFVYYEFRRLIGANWCS
jgi:hypothetical protein